MNTTLLTTRWPQLHETVIRRLQASKLRRYLRDLVLPFSAYYRDLFRQLGLTSHSIQTLEDLQKLPLTSKSDLLNSPDHPERAKDFILIPDQKILARRLSTLWHAVRSGRENVKLSLESEFRPIFMTSTTGRSADPIPFLYTGHDVSNLLLSGRRLFEVCGGERAFRMVNMFPYAPHLAFWQTHYGGVAFGALVVSSGGGKVMGTEGNLRLIRKLKPDVLIGMPTFTYHVLHQAVEEGLHWENLRRIVLGGEKVPDGLRRKLRDLAAEVGSPNVDVISVYGFTEAKMAWAECPYPREGSPSGFHLYPDLGVVEIIHPQSGEPVPHGQPGEIVFTPLDARGSVVLRYRTGDFIDGGLVYEPCPYCGRCVPRLVGRISRSAEVKEMRLDKIKGTLVDFNQLEHLLDDAPGVGAWQLELRKRHDDPLEVDELVLHVQKTNGAEEESLVRDLNRRVALEMEVHPNRIIFHSAEAMRELQGVGRQLKELKVVDHRPSADSGVRLASLADSPVAEPSGPEGRFRTGEKVEVTA